LAILLIGKIKLIFEINFIYFILLEL
jgi:hypothetical protein